VASVVIITIGAATIAVFGVTAAGFVVVEYYV
jgi:hypothetical protein